MYLKKNENRHIEKTLEQKIHIYKRKRKHTRSICQESRQIKFQNQKRAFDANIHDISYSKCKRLKLN